MWRATIKGLLAHKLRLALTGLAVVLGVTFVSGTFVLTDTLHDTFTSLFGNIYQNVDFGIRSVAAFSDSSGASAPRRPIPQWIGARVAALPGVAAAVGQVEGYAQFVARDGKVIANGQAPTIGASFDTDPEMASEHIVSGSAPTGPGQVAMDQVTATKYGFRPGDRVRVLLVGPSQTFTISGIARFGTAGNLGGATLASFDLPVAQRLFDDVGVYNDVLVRAEPGVDMAKLQRAIAAVLPRGVQVVTGKTLQEEATTSIDQALGFFSTALLVFAFISLFVGAFTIFNTFSILVGQRTRELALLRILGASRRQLFRSVLAEAGILGLVASLVGLGLGVLTAKGLVALLAGFGVSLPSGPLVFAARTVVVSLVVGIGVTVVSAVSPARRAVRIPPVAALSDQALAVAESSRRRIVIGSVVGVGGVVVLALGLTVPAIELVGIGAAAIFVAAAMLAPVVARPVAGAIGRPVGALFGYAGRLGRENSMRSPRRTAQTAAALMVGLALTSVIAVFGASLSKTATSSVVQAISADYIVTNKGAGNVSTAVAQAASKVPGLSAVATVYAGDFQFRNAVQQVTAVDPRHLSDTIILRVSAGTGAPALAAGDLLVDTTTATSDNLHVGSVVPVRFVWTGRQTMRIGGIFKPNALLGSYLVSDGFFTAHFHDPSPVAVLARTPAGPTARTTKALDRELAAYPNLQVQTRAQFEKAEEAQVNQLLGLVYALLFLAVIIAFIGIVNTLVLSVFERTHEIGLLRAVGMRRRQVRAMIRSESVVIALFGAVIGIVIGTALGVALAWSLKKQGITDIAIPASSLVAFVVLGALLGLLAASWPARRAARLDVLAAISAE